MQIDCKGTLPERKTVGSAGADLQANQDYVLVPGEQALIETGTAVAIPEMHFGILLPRSSLCNKRGLVMVNSVGVIDSDYRGTMKCCYKNFGDKPVIIKKGEGIAQLIISPFVLATFNPVEVLDDTVRGVGGFGSTDKAKCEA